MFKEGFFFSYINYCKDVVNIYSDMDKNNGATQMANAFSSRCSMKMTLQKWERVDYLLELYQYLRRNNPGI
ncbi:hypothetical protein M514_09535 [Trichuris suis]|uniref:Uncharacterized protein n=1 Tax=Trichuris suis TaxID=68888 RepID=A0A085LX96_9BILA|nr:hypothetical protein M513_09535 [Trichuris suis]KFD70155.1 hypothetical protein M514_09535 [Trichuris suis]